MGLNSAPKSKAQAERDAVQQIVKMVGGDVGRIHGALLAYTAGLRITRHERNEAIRRWTKPAIAAVMEHQKQAAPTPMKPAPIEVATQLQIFNHRDADFEHPPELEMDENRPPIDQQVDDDPRN
jgi:hypothetical protein